MIHEKHILQSVCLHKAIQLYLNRNMTNHRCLKPICFLLKSTCSLLTVIKPRQRCAMFSTFYNVTDQRNVYTFAMFIVYVKYKWLNTYPLCILVKINV